ncbi:hypothetical protein [Rhizobium leguminosarum]|uniref:hypothetical protein n=1 Tax=Rhizobium leguminosarum TaxID=384 RepID=UPI0011AE8BE9|nr:hypothetical protein [Rhizobium leguminosarum]
MNGDPAPRRGAETHWHSARKNKIGRMSSQFSEFLNEIRQQRTSIKNESATEIFAAALPLD